MIKNVVLQIVEQHVHCLSKMRNRHFSYQINIFKINLFTLSLQNTHKWFENLELSTGTINETKQVFGDINVFEYH